MKQKFIKAVKDFDIEEMQKILASCDSEEMIHADEAFREAVTHEPSAPFNYDTYRGRNYGTYDDYVRVCNYHVERLNYERSYSKYQLFIKFFLDLDYEYYYTLSQSLEITSVTREYIEKIVAEKRVLSLASESKVSSTALVEAEEKGKASYDSRSYFISEGFEAYHLSAMNILLGLRVIGLNDVNKLGIKVLPSHILKHSSQKSSLHKIISLFAKESSQHDVIIMPLLISFLRKDDVMHWVGIIGERVNGQLKISYLDSENQAVDRTLEVALVSEMQTLYSESSISFQQITFEQQRYNNCGPELIENFVYYLTNTRATQEAAIYIHSLLLENTLLDPVEYALKISENGKLIGFLSNQAPLMPGRVIGQVETALLITNSGYDASAQPSQNLGSSVFIFIHRLADKIASALNNGLMNACGVIMQNSYIKYQLMNYAYHDELSAINAVLNKPYLQSSAIFDVKALLQKHPLQWSDKDFKKIKLLVHPDKGGNDEDFRTVNDFQKQLGDKEQMYQNLLTKLIPDIQALIHKSNIGFKTIDIMGHL